MIGLESADAEDAIAKSGRIVANFIFDISREKTVKRNASLRKRIPCR